MHKAHGVHCTLSTVQSAHRPVWLCHRGKVCGRRELGGGRWAAGTGRRAAGAGRREVREKSQAPPAPDPDPDTHTHTTTWGPWGPMGPCGGSGGRQPPRSWGVWGGGSPPLRQPQTAIPPCERTKLSFCCGCVFSISFVLKPAEAS